MSPGWKRLRQIVPRQMPAPDKPMQYFLIRQNNELQHLPDFRLIAQEDADTAADGADGAQPFSNGKKPVQFMCPQRSAQLPLSFLVVDEEATVRVCSGRMLQTGAADFVLTGIVTDEYESPFKERALNGIQEAVAALSK